MGANAVTTVPVYVAGEVLTAADLNITNSGIPVFAGTTERDAAFGGTGEKVLAEGQYAYLESTNATQFYDGAAWVNVGASGLTYITGASFTSAATVSFATDTFTTTYDNYKVMLNITSATAGDNLRFRYRSAGTDNSTANYGVGGIGRQMATAATSTQEAVSDTGGYFFGVSTTAGAKCSIDIFSPKLTAQTASVSVNVGATSGVLLGSFSSNIFVATTSFDSMTIYPATGNITGSYKVYGYSNS